MAGDVLDAIRTTLTEKADQRGLEYGGEWMTWGDVARYGDAIAALLDQAGCPEEGRIGVVIRNRSPHAAAVIGLLAHRRSVSFIYPFLVPAVLTEQIADLGASAIIAAAEDWDVLRGPVAAAGSAGVSLGKVGEAPRLAEGVEKCTRPAPTEKDDGAIEVLSSGTTGTPKRIAMPLPILERAVMSAPGAEAGSVPPVQINIWPLGGVGGMCIMAASAVTATPMVLMDKFSVEGLMELIRRHRPPTIGLPPTAISMILDANVPPEDMESIKSISGGSAFLDPDVQEKFEKKYDLHILWGMGATEFCGTIIRWTPQMRAEVGDGKRGSMGQAMPGVELRVVDPETGNILPVGEEGLMEVHCPTIRPDWVRTTDLVMIDSDGYAFHRGRFDGAIVRGGFKILPERIVDALRQHPAVADASVIGLPDARLGAVPVAAVELVPDAPATTPADLTEHLRGLLAPTYIPADIRIVDALPRTPSLKVSLTDVRQIFEKQAA